MHPNISGRLTMAHLARMHKLRKNDKEAVVEADAFYAPTGTTRGKSTFKTDPYVKKAHVSAAMMPLFLTGLCK